MIVSSTLGIIGGLSGNDSSRNQMTNKQISQALVSKGQRHPHIIGDKFHYAAQTSKLYRTVAKDDGQVIAKNNKLLIVYYENLNKLELYVIDKYAHMHSNFSIEINYVIKDKIFKKGDLLYCYDGFTENSNGLTFGHNLNVLYSPFFGFPVEDSAVISKSAAKKMVHHKTERIIIPIYRHTILKPIWENELQFFPNIGDKINTDKVVIAEAISNKNSSLLFQSTESLLSILSDDTSFNTNKKLTKLNNPIVEEIKVHRVGVKKPLLFQPLNDVIVKMNIDYLKEVKQVQMELSKSLSHINNSIVDDIIRKYYLLTNVGQLFDDTNDLIYIVEIELLETKSLTIGGKVANLYGGKGIISKVLDDDKMPVDEYGEKVDLIITPISVYGRMNFGQLIEGTLSRPIHFLERDILKNKYDVDKVIKLIETFLEILKLCNTEDYISKIKEKLIIFKTDYSEFQKFIKDIEKYGLFFELPLFGRINLDELTKKIEETYGIKSETIITYKKEVIEEFAKELNIPDFAIPKEDVKIKAFCSYIYYMKLYKIAEELMRVRDVGPVNAISKINTKGENIPVGNSQNYMEIFSILSHGLENTLHEFRNAKSDNIAEKQRSMMSFIQDGYYEQDTSVKEDPPTKKNIQAYINLINN